MNAVTEVEATAVHAPGTDLAAYTAHAPEEYRARFVMEPAEAAALDEQLRNCMRAVLKPDVDYGLIPGMGKTPSLFKPGAEKLIQWFGFGFENNEVKIERDDPDCPSGIADKVRRVGVTYRCTVYKELADGRRVTVATCEAYAGYDEDKFFISAEAARAKAEAKERQYAAKDKRQPSPAKWEHATEYRAPWNSVIKMCLAASTPLLVKSPDGEYLTEATRLYSWISKPTAPQVCVPGPDGEWVPITDMFRNGVQPVLRITLRDGTEHRVTAAHRFLTSRGLVPAGDLAIGDVLTRRTIPLAGMKEPDPDFGWLVGLVIADGHITRWGVGITLGQDEEQLAQRAVWIGRRLGCPARYEQRPDMKAWQVTISGPAILGLLRQFIAGKNSYDKHLRATAWRAGSDFLDGVLRGWLDGDGSWMERPGRRGWWRVGFTGHNDAWLRDLRVLGAALGYRVNVRTGSSKAGGKTFGTFVGDVKPPAGSHGNNADSAQVMSVEPDGETMTYDLEVGTPDHLYLLHDGTVTHNCEKRSLVGASIDATAAAGLFTQDLEDMRGNAAPDSGALAEAATAVVMALPGDVREGLDRWYKGKRWPEPGQWSAEQWCTALQMAGYLTAKREQPPRPPQGQPTAAAAAQGPAEAPQAADDPEADPSPEDDPETEFVRSFVARTAGASEERIGRMRVELGKAVQAGVIAPETANELGRGLAERMTQVRSAAA
jgi:hypothetical protein